MPESLTQEVICPECGSKAALMDRQEFSPGLATKGKIWICWNHSQALTVGTHEGTDLPLGTLADIKTRRARREAHKAFDRIWKGANYGYSRDAAYRSGAGWLGLKELHIGECNVDQCRRLIAWAKNLIRGHKQSMNATKASSKSRISKKVALAKLGKRGKIKLEKKKNLRKQYFETFGQDGIASCQICGENLTEYEADACYKIDASLGGSEETENILIAHGLRSGPYNCNEFMEQSIKIKQEARESHIDCETGGVVQWSQEIKEKLAEWRKKRWIQPQWKK